MCCVVRKVLWQLNTLCWHVRCSLIMHMPVGQMRRATSDTKFGIVKNGLLHAALPQWHGWFLLTAAQTIIPEPALCVNMT